MLKFMNSGLVSVSGIVQGSEDNGGGGPDWCLSIPGNGFIGCTGALGLKYLKVRYILSKKKSISNSFDVREGSISIFEKVSAYYAKNQITKGQEFSEGNCGVLNFSKQQRKKLT